MQKGFFELIESNCNSPKIFCPFRKSAFTIEFVHFFLPIWFSCARWTQTFETDLLAVDNKAFVWTVGHRQ